jgi:hypothetical protein
VTPVLAQSNLVERPRRELLPIVGLDELSASNKELAQQLEIWPMLEELYDKTKRPSVERRDLLRQKIRETIMESFFDAISVQAEAAREQGYLVALRETLQDKTDRSLEVNNATNFIGSGTLNTIGSVLGFTNDIPPFPGNFFQMLSGVVSTGMSTYALKQQKGARTRGPGQPTVVAELFGRPVDERTTYPESVWRFFHGQSMESLGKTRIELLEDRWIARRELEPHGSPHEQQKLDKVSGAATGRNVITVDDLNDEINMITDIGALAARMSHHLRDLLALIDSDIPPAM